MFVLVLLATEIATMTPLPAEMEAVLEPYSECVSGAFRKRIVAAEASANLDQTNGPKLMAEAITDCVSERRNAVAASNRALAANPAFADATVRRNFIEERLDFLDDTLVWSVSPEGDPDNWE